MATLRERRLNYAKRLIAQHPEWGRRQIEDKVKKRFGVGLRSSTVSNLKRSHANRLVRQVRVDYARDIIIQNPEWGRDKINLAIQKKFGVGLRIVDIARLKDATLLGRAKKSTGRKSVAKLIEEQVLLPEATEKEKGTKLATIGFDEAFHLLRSAGFMPFEIRNLFSAMGVSLMFTSKPFKAMLKSRRAWIRELKKRGKTNDDIIKLINQYYSVKDAKGGPKHSPFDFLRKEYMPRRKVSKDVFAVALRKRKRAADSTEGLYGKGHRKPVIVR